MSFNDEFGDDLLREYTLYLERFLPIIKENPKEAKKIVVFLHINHQLNLKDPIGCCYPTVFDEYSDYARKMAKHFLEQEDKYDFSQKLKKEMINMWLCIASNPYQDKKSIDNGCVDIINILYTELLLQKENQAERFVEDNYWLKEFYLFVNDMLPKERIMYKRKAVLFQEEIDLLIKEKEKNLNENKDNLDGYIFFLFINHNLNLLDPTEKYYPGLTYPYEKFSWQIVSAYKNNDEEEFINKTKQIINYMFEYLCCDASKSKDKINNTISTIKDELRLINK